MDDLFGLSTQTTDSEGTLWEVHSSQVLNDEEPLLANWQAVDTYSRQVRRVEPDLDMPTLASFQSVEIDYNDRFNTGVQLPESSGYVYARSDAGDEYRAFGVLGALALADSTRGRWPVPNTEIENLCQGLFGHKVAPYVHLATGQKVRITAGPFAQMSGYLVRQAYCLHVVISVESIEQAVAVEVDIDEVEAMGPAPSAFEA